MERRRSSRGGWGRDLGIFLSQRAQIGAKNREKPSDLVGLTGILSRNALEEKGVAAISGLVGLTGILCWKSFRPQQMRADQNLWDLPASVSVSGAICGRDPRCAARSRDAAGGSGACGRRAFRTFLSAAAHRECGSSSGSWPAIADWTSASAFGDTLAGHRSLGVD